MITIGDLRFICPATRSTRLASCIGPLNAAMAEFKINSPLRRAHFLAQLAQESGGFNYLRELASGRDYEMRVDLGNVELGDGPRFKGWGWMQTTGRKNTRIVSLALFGDARLVLDPTLIDPPSRELAARAAGHFWTKGAGQNLSKRATTHGVKIGVDLNELADVDDAEGITLAVNGGLNGYQERLAYLTKLKGRLA